MSDAILPLLYTGSYFDKNVIGAQAIDTRYDIRKKKYFSYQYKQQKTYQKSLLRNIKTSKKVQQLSNYKEFQESEQQPIKSSQFRTR